MGSPFCLGCLLSEVFRLFLDKRVSVSLLNKHSMNYFRYGKALNGVSIIRDVEQPARAIARI